MTRIKAGIIGVGFIGPQHVEALRRLGFVEVVGVVGSSPARAQSVADRLFIDRVYPTYQEMLADPDIHVVHNCTPNRLHYVINRAALEAGKHIVSEKPLAMTPAETGALVELAAQSDRMAAVNFNHRGYPMVQQARAMIAQGELGELRLLHGSYLQDWLLYPSDWNWRIDLAEGGPSRAMADIGSHLADLLQHVSGHRITCVFADLGTLLPTRSRPTSTTRTFGVGQTPVPTQKVGVATEDYGTVMFTTDHGARGTFTVSQVSAGRKNKLSFELDGSRAAVAWDADTPEFLWVGHRDKPNEYIARDPSLVAESVTSRVQLPGGHYEGWPDALKNCLADVYRAIQDGRTQPADGDIFATFVDGHRSATLVDAILASARTQRWIEVPSSEGNRATEREAQSLPY